MVDDVLGRNGDGGALCCGATVDRPRCASVDLPELIVLRSVDYAAVFAVGTVAMAAGATLDYVYLAERRARDLFTRNSAAAAVKVLVLGLLGLAAGPDAVRLLGAWGVAAVCGLGLGAALLVRYARVARPPALSVLVRTALGLRSRATGHQLIGMGAGLLPYLLPLLVTARLVGERKRLLLHHLDVGGTLSRRRTCGLAVSVCRGDAPARRGGYDGSVGNQDHRRDPSSRLGRHSCCRRDTADCLRSGIRGPRRRAAADNRARLDPDA